MGGPWTTGVCTEEGTSCEALVAPPNRIVRKARAQPHSASLWPLYQDTPLPSGAPVTFSWGPCQ